MKSLVTLVMVLTAAGTFAAELTIAPSHVELSGSRETQRLLVSRWLDDRTHCDVSRDSRFDSSDPSVAIVDQSGIVQPKGNGTAEIIVTHDGLEDRVTVSVAKFEKIRSIDFRTEVIAALSRGGCSQGACHGSPQGKNGFRLSLRGFDPDLDWLTLSKEIGARRLNQFDPSKSLILQKATGKVAHQGGVRLRRDDLAFALVKRWITEGCLDAPDSPKLVRLEILPSRGRLLVESDKESASQQLIVQAHFDNGSVLDVTELAVFSTESSSATVSERGLVEFQQTSEVVILARYLDKVESSTLTFVRRDPDFQFTSPRIANFVDRDVFEKQRELQLRPTRIAGDGVFLRRVFLDVTGGIPTPDEARKFIESKDSDKRSKLIDELLEREEYAQFWALKWADIMRGSRETISERGVHNFHRYLVRNFADDRSFRDVANEIVTGLGNTIHSPSANFYRVSRTPTDAAESFSQLFLGVRIGCAKCHNHPYESITQRDYYGLAAHFARVKIKGTRFGIDDETVYISDQGEVRFPGREEDVEPVAFGATSNGDNQDRRIFLATWLTKGDNRFFARSTVNRIWAHLLGRGIVEPVDDFRDSNPPTNAKLLDNLVKLFVDNGYRFKPVIRTILNSSTYQLAAERQNPPSKFAADDANFFTRAEISMLAAEQIIDAISMATGIDEQFQGYPHGTKAIALAEGAIEHRFLKAFAKPVRDVGCDCARETEPGINHVLHLINNSEILVKIESPKSRLAKWHECGNSTDEVITSIYLATLSRMPTEAEKKLGRSHVEQLKGGVTGFQDLQHALINSNEFLLRH